MELLVVMTIIVILAAMLMPALQNARWQAQKVVCMSNLRQLGIIFQMYLQDWDERYPVGFGLDSGNPTQGTCDNFSDAAGTFNVWNDDWFGISHYPWLLRDYIYCQDPFQQYPSRHKLFQCPSDPQVKSWATSERLWSHRYNAQTVAGKRLVVIEKEAGLSGWTGPTKRFLLRCRGNYHTTNSGGWNELYCDGHVEHWEPSQRTFTYPDSYK